MHGFHLVLKSVLSDPITSRQLYACVFPPGINMCLHVHLQSPLVFRSHSPTLYANKHHFHLNRPITLSFLFSCGRQQCTKSRLVDQQNAEKSRKVIWLIKITFCRPTCVEFVVYFYASPLYSQTNENEMEEQRDSQCFAQIKLTGTFTYMRHLSRRSFIVFYDGFLFPLLKECGRMHLRPPVNVVQVIQSQSRQQSILLCFHL